MESLTAFIKMKAFDEEAKIPENMNLDDFSMACILGNLLDNAIAAAQNAQKPEIQVKISFVKQNLYLKIKNSYGGVLLYEFGKLQSQKGDKDIHGFGLQSVAQEVERHMGSMEIEHDHNTFTVIILLPIQNDGYVQEPDGEENEQVRG